MATNSGFSRTTRLSLTAARSRRSGAVTLADDTLNGNSAGFDGGSIDHEKISAMQPWVHSRSARPQLRTISPRPAGNCIYNGNDSMTLITNTTIANNSVYSDGGGIFELFWFAHSN